MTIRFLFLFTQHIFLVIPSKMKEKDFSNE